MGIPDPLKAEAGRAQGVSLCPLTPAALIGLGALQIALVLVFFDPLWTLGPLVAFVVLMGLAPFFPAWRLFLPVIRRGLRDDAVALTFDDGPDPATTPRLLELLASRKAKATFFCVGEAAAENPDLIRQLLAAGHELGNHTQDHDLGFALRSRSRMRRSIGACQKTLAELGARPFVFRPPAWVVNPGLWRVLLENGLTCVLASRKGLDFGNRRLAGLADRLLSRVRGGDIVALHDVTPPAPGRVEDWLAEVEALLDGLAKKGLETMLLSGLIGRPSMELMGQAAEPSSGASRSVQAFYDGLSSGYDGEQESHGQGGLRAAESEAVLSRLDQILAGGEGVLEVGAGTGRFSLEIAGRADHLLALDLSPGMLSRLEEKARAAGRENLETFVGDLRSLPAERTFDLVCAFSVIEYMPDLAGCLTDLSQRLAPGARLYLTTARRCPLRLVGQVGNALRQGFWLHARSEGQMRTALARAGLTVESLTAFGPGRLLLEVLARKQD
jgi:peptidoglycan/xylan/chitin deacetylase (PgdA/CDA1 family)/SAM-dependent methyltransferase